MTPMLTWAFAVGVVGFGIASGCIGYLVGLRHGFSSGFAHGLLTASSALDQSAKALREASPEASTVLDIAAKRMAILARDVPE